MKVLYITNGIGGPGGLERVLSIKASYLSDSLGYTVEIVSLFEKSRDRFYDFSPSIKFHYLELSNRRPFSLFDLIRNLRRLIANSKPAIVCVCDDGLKGLWFPVFLPSGPSYIYERHVSKLATLRTGNGNFTRTLNKIKNALMELGADRYDSFVVLTEGNKREWNCKNIEIIPNPLTFYPSDNEISNLKNKMVIAVGKQSYQKGYDRLLKAWAGIIKETPEWQLEIYGTFQEEQGLELLADELGIQAHVLFKNPVKNIGDQYQRASVYVLSSRYEGFGMVLTEAMSYGVPCVSFDCPYGPADIISHNRDGILVSNGDIEGLTRALKRLIDNEQLRRAYGLQARSSVQRYLPENICGQWHDLFTQLSR